MCCVAECPQHNVAASVSRFIKMVFAYRSMFMSADRQQHISIVLKLVSQMVRLFLPSSHAGHMGNGHCLDIASDPDFWSILRYAMVNASLKADGI